MRKQSTIVGLISGGLVLATTAFVEPCNLADRALGGGLVGAGTGAVIGAIAGGGRGAGIGAAVGGGVARSRAPPLHLPARSTAIIAITSSTAPIEP